MNLHPLMDGIFFQFYDDSTSTRFINKTGSDIATAISATDQSNKDRWAKVVSIGPKVSQVKIGEWILVESGYWTPAFNINGVKHWKTDETHVMMASDIPYSIY